MDFIIPAETLGTDFSLIVKEDGSYEKYDPDKKLETRIVSVKSRGFWERIKLYELEVPSFPPEKFTKPYKHLLSKNVKVPWAKCIPSGLYQKSLAEYITGIRQVLDGDFSYYNDYFSQTNLIFNDLAQANIDTDKFNTFLNDDKGAVASKAILRSFTPIHFDNQAGLSLTDKVVYSRTSSKTGRLTVVRGPQILHLKTEYRQILKSRFEGGGIFYLDYKSLEPRTLLAKKFPDRDIPKDIYQDALQSLDLEGRVGRDAVKTALISTINGAGEKEVTRQLNGKVDYPEEFIQAINEHFGLNELREEIAEQYAKNGGRRIYNHYGRPIACEQTPPYVLLNYFVQSTAVDIALLGFNQIWTKLLEVNATDFIQPLFILHDALILDVAPDLFHLLEKIASVGTQIPKFDNVHFWIEVERLT